MIFPPSSRKPAGARATRAPPSTPTWTGSRGSGKPDVTSHVIGFYLVPDFPLIALASAMEPLRIANRLSGRRLYDWRLISRNGAPERASNGLLLNADAGIAKARACAFV